MLRELKLDIHSDKRVTSLSGGQRKRVSVALELLTKPSLIFLDETSGLDPGMDRDVMLLLRGLADDGRTVLVVTHSVAELALCDKLLVMAPSGSVAYFGPPEEALNFFGYETWADVFSASENYRDYDWASRWRGSQHFQMYAADIDAVAPQSVHVQPPPARMQKPQSWASQLWTLMRRYVSVIASDRGFIGLMVILPAVLGAVSVVIPSDYGLVAGPKGQFNQDAGTIMLILAVGMCFSGAANSVRELIKERVIYERERAVGLSRSAYLMSKVIVLGLITALQGVIISAIDFSARNLPDEGLIFPPAAELCLVIIALGFTSMMFGLAHLLAGEEGREDHAAARDVRDRAGRLHRRAVQDLRLARHRAVRVPDALALADRRLGRHARPLARHGTLGPHAAEPPRPAVGALGQAVYQRHACADRARRRLRLRRRAAAAPPRAGGHAQVAPPASARGGRTNAAGRHPRVGCRPAAREGTGAACWRGPKRWARAAGFGGWPTVGSVRRVDVVHGAVLLGRVVAGGRDVGDRVVDVPGRALDV